MHTHVHFVSYLLSNDTYSAKTPIPIGPAKKIRKRQVHYVIVNAVMCSPPLPCSIFITKTTWCPWQCVTYMDVC